MLEQKQKLLTSRKKSTNSAENVLAMTFVVLLVFQLQNMTVYSFFIFQISFQNYGVYEFIISCISTDIAMTNIKNDPGLPTS
jgi:hypothetical protein